jgi:hypothetical protein
MGPRVGEVKLRCADYVYLCSMAYSCADYFPESLKTMGGALKGERTDSNGKNPDKSLILLLFSRRLSNQHYF